MHCDDAPCVDAAPAGAVYERPDGIVIIDPEKAKGRPEIAQKCTGCVHLLEEGWTQTRCAQVCPTEALTLVLAEDAEMAQMSAAERLEVYRPVPGTAPRVHYKNLYRWTKAYVAGSVVFGDTGECAEGVTVTARRNGVTAGQDGTNNLGDFLVDKLEPGEYVVDCSAGGYVPEEMAVTVDKNSTSLPPLFLQPA